MSLPTNILMDIPNTIMLMFSDSTAPSFYQTVFYGGTALLVLTGAVLGLTGRLIASKPPWAHRAMGIALLALALPLAILGLLVCLLAFRTSGQELKLPLGVTIASVVSLTVGIVILIALERFGLRFFTGKYYHPKPWTQPTFESDRSIRQAVKTELAAANPNFNPADFTIETEARIAQRTLLENYYKAHRRNPFRFPPNPSAGRLKRFSGV